MASWDVWGGVRGGGYYARWARRFLGSGARRRFDLLDLAAGRGMKGVPEVDGLLEVQPVLGLRVPGVEG